jgi:uncharacterized protein (TIGR02246 family)
MKFSFLSLALLVLASHWATAQTAPTPLSDADKAGVVATLQHFQKNLNDHKFSEMVDYTTPDVTVVNIVGMLWQGEPAVQKGHQVVFDNLYKGVTFPPLNPASLSMRTIAPEIVVVVRGSKPLPPGVPPHPQTTNTTVLVKRQGRWLITAFQNTLFDPVVAANDPTLAKE